MLGMILGFLRFSSNGYNVIMFARYKFLREVNKEYDYHDYWRKGTEAYEDLSFYKLILRSVRHNLFSNADALNWFIDFGIASRLISMESLKTLENPPPIPGMEYS